MSSISVVVPVRDGAATLGRCLEAAAREGEGCDGFELIVVDDSSTDGSAEIARGCGARVLSMDRNRGPAAARDLGAREARGDILVFLDSDIRVRTGTVAALAALASGVGVGAAFCPYDPATTYERAFSSYANLMSCYWFSGIPDDASVLVAAAMAIRREVFLGAGCFDESLTLPSVEDIDLGWRLRARGLRLAFARDLPVDHLAELAPRQFWTSRYHMARLWIGSLLRVARGKGRPFRPFDPWYHPVNALLLALLLLAAAAAAASLAPPQSLAAAALAFLAWNLPFLAFSLRHAPPAAALAAFAHALAFPAVHLAGLAAGALELALGRGFKKHR